MSRRVPCANWPCRRCDKAGRSSWRAREKWHASVRSRAEFGRWSYFGGWILGMVLCALWERYDLPDWLGIVTTLVVWYGGIYAIGRAALRSASGGAS